MSLMIIVICLIAERFLLDLQHLRRYPWLESYDQWLAGRTLPERYRRGILRLLLLLIPPVLIIGMLQQLFDAALFGLPGLLFAGMVLLYTLGPDDLDTQVGAYSHAVERGDDDSVRQLARQLIMDEPPTSEPALSQSVSESILYQANLRIFGVVFWFLLLGPLGALLYRTATRLPDLNPANRDPDFYLYSKQLLFILDWLPARVTATCYAIAGSFEDALYGWRGCQESRFGEFSDSNSGTLICSGGGAMRLTTLLDETQNEALRDYSHLPQAAMALVWRSLVVWLIILGLLSLAGVL